MEICTCLEQVALRFFRAGELDDSPYDQRHCPAGDDEPAEELPLLEVIRIHRFVDVLIVPTADSASVAESGHCGDKEPAYQAYIGDAI